MSDLVEFLLSRIAEDEAEANRALADKWGEAQWSTAWWSCDEQGSHVAVDPPRAVAECEAKRRIVKAAREASGDHVGIAMEFCVGKEEWDEHMAEDPGDAIFQALAAVYADHPDFDEAWRP